MTIVPPPLPSLPPLSLYVHLPWCVAKCPYCDFNSYTLHGELPEAAYIDALLGDLAVQLPDIGSRAVVSVFFGGGTPSLFSPSPLASCGSPTASTWSGVCGLASASLSIAGSVELAACP